jgi:sortase A
MNLRRIVLGLATLVAAVDVSIIVVHDETAARELDALGAAVGRSGLDAPRLEITPTSAPAVTVEGLPQPAAPPSADYMDEPIVEIGRLAIPALGVDQPLYQGLSLTNIDHGPAHWPGTAMPGRLGNVVVAGHRVTRTRPFRHVDDLRPGDQAIFTTVDGQSVYEFVGTEIVTPDRVDIVNQTADYTATFYACHPPGSARYRIVARWRLVSAPFDG